MVTIAEAIALSEYRPISDIYVSQEIKNEFLKIHQMQSDDLWKECCLLATIWNAGRIQGIREERKKAKQYKGA